MKQTPSQTVGPFYSIGMTHRPMNSLVTDQTPGQRIHIEGQVIDGDGTPVPDAMVEIWQANAAGRYRHPVDQHNAPLDPNFTGAGRCMTNDKGEYRFLTIKPGAYPWLNHANAWRPAHIHLSLFGPSFVTRLITQFFFPGDPLLEMDPILTSIPIN